MEKVWRCGAHASIGPPVFVSPFFEIRNRPNFGSEYCGFKRKVTGLKSILSWLNTLSVYWKDRYMPCQNCRVDLIQSNIRPVWRRPFLQNFHWHHLASLSAGTFQNRVVFWCLWVTRRPVFIPWDVWFWAETNWTPGRETTNPPNKEVSNQLELQYLGHRPWTNWMLGPKILHEMRWLFMLQVDAKLFVRYSVMFFYSQIVCPDAVWYPMLNQL